VPLLSRDGFRVHSKHRLILTPEILFNRGVVLLPLSISGFPRPALDQALIADNNQLIATLTVAATAAPWLQFSLLTQGAAPR
jgi:hypothetical protein